MERLISSAIAKIHVHGREETAISTAILQYLQYLPSRSLKTSRIVNGVYSILKRKNLNDKISVSV